VFAGVFAVLQPGIVSCKSQIYASCSHVTLYMQEAHRAIAEIKVTSERLKEALAVPELPHPVLQSELAEDEECAVKSTI
jgi:hypothetical protein